jgi:hypothetical protein
MFSVLAVALALGPTDHSSCATRFEDVAQRHFQAIETRDLVDCMAMIAAEDGPIMILPDGGGRQTGEAVESEQLEWYADPTWTFEFEPVGTFRESSFGLLVRPVQVLRPDRKSPPFLLSILLAEADNGCWYLRHDQNTLILESGPQSSDCRHRGGYTRPIDPTTDSPKPGQALR